MKTSEDINKSDFELLKKYPKKRPSLNDKLKKIFDNEYKKNRSNSLSQISESWLHYSIKGRKNTSNNTLEIGAGSLNHIPYEKYSCDKKYDVIEPKKFLYEDSPNKKHVNNFYKNFTETPDNYYDRIISCAVLEHLEDLPNFLYLSSFKLKENGYHSHSVPCEGYPVWNITWYFFNAIPFKLRTGQNFKDIQKHEHLNTFDEILALINFFYKKVEIKYSYPLFFSPYFSFYANINFWSPIKKNIDQYEKLI
jgi:hypothetical protein